MIKELGPGMVSKCSVPAAICPITVGIAVPAILSSGNLNHWKIKKP